MDFRYHIFVGSFATILFVSLAPSPCHSHEGLNVSADAGYSLILPEGFAYPSYIHGAAARARLGYGFDDTWGVEGSLGLSWYQPYTPYNKLTVTDKDGTSTTYEKGTPVEQLRIQDLALMATYAVDVYRVTPTLALGVSSARILETKNDLVSTAHDLAIRFEVSLDVSVVPVFSLGVQFGLDSFLLGSSPYTTRNNFLIRATFHWDVRNLGRSENTR